MIIYVGTYTLPAGHVKESKGEGIHAYHFDEGRLTHLHTTTGIDNPTYLTIHGNYLYAISEVQEGMVYAYRIDPETGVLTFINKQSAGGAGPAYIAVIDDKYALVANYGGGNVALLPLNDDGSLAPPSSIVNHEGATAPHAHCLYPIDNHTALAADLGIDKVIRYTVRDGQLTAQGSVDLPHGAGPRHITHDGDSIYVINELNSTISLIQNDTIVQTIPTLPDDFTGANSCADIHISDGYLYGSNRGHNSIVVCRIEADSTLTVIQHISTHGETPRNFLIVPGYLLVANQDSHNVTAYAIKDGLLEYTGISNEVPAPVCLKPF